MNDPVYTLQRGRTPLLVSLPHAGTHIPPALAARLQPRALQVEVALEVVVDVHLPVGVHVVVDAMHELVLVQRGRRDGQCRGLRSDADVLRRSPAQVLDGFGRRCSCGWHDGGATRGTVGG